MMYSDLEEGDVLLNEYKIGSGTDWLLVRKTGNVVVWFDLRNGQTINGRLNRQVIAFDEYTVVKSTAR